MRRLDACANGKRCAADSDCRARKCNSGTCGPIGAACSRSEDCPPEAVCASGTCYWATSCKELLAAHYSSASGVATLDPDSSTGAADPFDAYCDMTSDGGGWTLALKVDGTKATFSYDAALWTNQATHNPGAPDLDGTEAKLASFSSVPFADVRVGFKENGPTSWLKLTLTGSSLSSVFSRGAYLSTSVGRTAWLSSMSGASIQGGCNSEGFNVVASNATYSRVRIGILGNNESDCTTSDSWMGIGGIFPLLGSSNVSCGVIHGFLSTQIYRPATGYVLVR